MNGSTRSRHLMIAAALSQFIAAGSLGSVQFIVDQPLISVDRNTVAPLVVVIVNDGADTVYLNGITIGIDGSTTTADTQPFFDRATLALAPGSSWAGSIADLSANADAALGDIFGKVELIGGPLPTSSDSLGEQFIGISVESPFDLSGDDLLGIQDLLVLIGEWGACPMPPDTCAADLDQDGVVGVSDLLLLLDVIF